MGYNNKLHARLRTSSKPDHCQTLHQNTLPFHRHLYCVIPIGIVRGYQAQTGGGENRVLKLLRHVVRATKFSVPNKSVDAFAKPTWRSCLFHHCFHFSKMRRIRLTKERTITDQTMWKVLLTFPECCVGKFMPA